MQTRNKESSVREGEEEESFATGMTKIDNLMGTYNGRITNPSKVQDFTGEIYNTFENDFQI